jgi:glyoxylase-like metal-dependent hydrolase (beta-lactamase superfamily II)
VSFEAIPGHTLGQLAVRLTSQGASALFSGDVFHQPMQIVRPAWNSRFCEHQDIARVTARARARRERRHRYRDLPSHFGTPHAGTIRRNGSGYRFNPLAVDA